MISTVFLFLWGAFFVSLLEKWTGRTAVAVPGKQYGTNSLAKGRFGRLGEKKFHLSLPTD